MKPILQTLAELYRKSPLRQRDFTIEYEKFLRLAGAADGDARELAEKELRRAESESDGIFRIDRHKRSGIPEKIRIALEGGEDWLFAKTGTCPPTAEREEAAGFFERSAEIPVPEKWRSAWRDFCTDLAARARVGASTQPFSPDKREALMEIVTGVLNWQGESLVRYASARISGDSKRLESLESRALAVLSAITGESSLEAFGILHKPRYVTFHGPLVLENGGDRTDFSKLPAPVSLSAANLGPLSTAARICLTVENEDVFIELAKRNSGSPGVLLVRTSFPGSAVRQLVSLLPEMTFLHFGDSDPAGFDILRDLREKTGRPFLPLLMRHRPSPQPVALSETETATLQRLIETPSMRDLRDELETILRTNDKGLFEQETIPVEEVLETLERIA